jgi:hypothetical protein
VRILVRCSWSVMFALCFLCIAWLQAAPLADAAPNAQEKVPSCKIGGYLTDLYDLNTENGRFSARVWLWSLCSDRKLDPIPGISFPNGDNPDKTGPTVTEEGGHFRDLVEVEGSFRYNWDVRRFPFDRHRIELLVTAPQDIEHFRFTPDRAGSSYNPQIVAPGWRITGFRLFTADQHYPTNFGDTMLPAGVGSSYSRMHIQIDLERSDPTIFWKLTGALYLMMLIAAFMFLLSSNDELGTAERLDGLQNRLGLLSGGLFIVVLNMQQANTVVDSTSGLTLIDELHLITLTFLLIAVLGTVLIWRATVRSVDQERIDRVSRIGGVLGLVGYVVLVGVCVLAAAL